MIESLSDNRVPKIDASAFVAGSADIVGDVKIGKDCSIWYQSVLRGDVMPIEIGDETNIQDQSCIHGTYQKAGTKIGHRVSIGHRVTLHGCEIDHHCLIGMGSIVMDNAKVGHHCLVGAGSLITEGKEFPPGQLIVGAPAKVKRPLTEEEIQFLDTYADKYLFYKKWYTDEKENS